MSLQAKSDFEKVKDIKGGDKVWYHGRYGISEYTMHRKGSSGYIVRLEGTCSDVAYIGHADSMPKGVFRTSKAAYEYDLYRAEQEVKVLKSIIEERH